MIYIIIGAILLGFLVYLFVTGGTMKSVKGGDELLYTKDGEMFVNGEHVEGSWIMPEKYVQSFGTYSPLVQDPTDLTSSNWDKPVEEKPSLHDIAFGLAEPHFKLIEKFSIELVTVISDKHVKVVASIVGVHNESDELLSYFESFIIRNKSVMNICMLDLKYPKSDLATKLKVKELQLISDPSPLISAKDD